MSICMWKNSTPILNQEYGRYTGFWGYFGSCVCVCVYVCVCVCERERERETDRQTDRQTDIQMR